MGTWINFAEIRQRVSLEDVIFTLYGITNLKRDGEKLVGPCPVHGGDSTRAFHADLGKSVWHCFSKCQGGGNQLDFVAKKEGINIREAALKLHARFLSGERVPVATPSIVPSAPATPAPSHSTPAPVATVSAPKRAVDTSENDEEVNRPLTFKLDLKSDHPHLVTERKLRQETCEHFGVGYCSRGILRGMIAIPVHDEDGDLVAYAGRRMKPSDIREHGKYKFPAKFAKSRVLYNYHRVKENLGQEGVIVVEGFFAAMALHEAGLTQVVATMGVELSAYQAKLLSTAKDVIVLFDGDDAGRHGSKSIREQLGATIPVRIVRLPPGAKPDHLSPKALRWIVNGMRAVDLIELAYVPRASAPPSAP